MTTVKFNNSIFITSILHIDYSLLIAYICIMGTRVISAHFAKMVGLSKQRIHQLIPRIRHNGPEFIKGYKVDVEDVEDQDGKIWTYLNILESPEKLM